MTIDQMQNVALIVAGFAVVIALLARRPRS